MRRLDEQALYEKRKHVALSNMGQRGGRRSVILKMLYGIFEQHMYRMTVLSAAARRQRKLARNAAKPLVSGADYTCPLPSCHHRWRGKRRTAQQCPKCGQRLAAKRVRQLSQANLRMYPDELLRANTK